MLAPTKAIELKDVASVYSGKNGCACGCRGRYSYAAAHVAYSSRYRGYKIDEDEVSDARVKRVVNKVNRNLSSAKMLSEKQVTFQDGNRLYMVMLKS